MINGLEAKGAYQINLHDLNLEGRGTLYNNTFNWNNILCIFDMRNLTRYLGIIQEDFTFEKYHE